MVVFTSSLHRFSVSAVNTVCAKLVVRLVFEACVSIVVYTSYVGRNVCAVRSILYVLVGHTVFAIYLGNVVIRIHAFGIASITRVMRIAFTNFSIFTVHITRPVCIICCMTGTRPIRAAQTNCVRQTTCYVPEHHSTSIVPVERTLRVTIDEGKRYDCTVCPDCTVQFIFISL